MASVDGNGLIYQRIPKIMAAMSAIGKNQTNQQQRYSFRGIDDVYNGLHKLLAEHEVFTVPEVLEDRHEERESRGGSTLIYRVLKIKYTFYAADGSNVSAVVMGEGMDSGDKASNKAMAVAHKYALVQVLAIPTADGDDPDAESHEVTTTKKSGNGKKINTEALDKGRESCMAEVARLIDTLTDESHDNYVTDIEAKHAARDIEGLRKLYAELKSKPAKTKNGPTIGKETEGVF